MKPKIIAKVYDKRGRLLAKAENSYQKTHPYQYRLAYQNGQPEKIYLHAEIRAIIKAQKKGKPYKIKVERKKANGEYGCSKPCEICEQAIKEAGIKKVEYTL